MGFKALAILPSTGEYVEFESSLPEDLKEALKQMG